MNFKLMSFFLFGFITLISCKDVSQETNVTVPADTKATIEYNQNQLDTISKNTTNEISFLGGGSEPSWSVEFKEGKIFFNAPNEVLRSFIAPIPEPEKDGKSSKYIAKSHRVIMEVLLTEEECVDGMSGKKKSHKVKLSIKPTSEKDFKIYEGCGVYTN